MTKHYKIIWIDDQYDEQESFCDQADRKGFDIIPFKTSREGMDYLRENLHDVDAVILDAKVFTESIADTASERGLMASLTKIASLSGQNNGKEIPHVIFTGQPDLCDDDDFAEKMNGIPVFSKNKSNETLFEKLRELIGDSLGATLRNRYPEAYRACGPDYLDRDCWRLLFPILSSIHSGASLHSNPYNDLRKVVELVFRLLYAKGVIHMRLIENDIVNIQGSSLFLSGKEVRLNRDGINVKAKSPIIPLLLGECVRFVLNLTHTGSHTADTVDVTMDRPSIPAVELLVPNHHLLETATLMTLDFIVWAKAYVDASPDPKINMANWEPMASGTDGVPFESEGTVISRNTRGQFFVTPDDSIAGQGKNLCIAPQLVRYNDLSRGARVRVKTLGRVLPNDAWEAVEYQLL
jgi:hypothetical protein